MYIQSRNIITADYECEKVDSKQNEFEFKKSCNTFKIFNGSINQCISGFSKSDRVRGDRG